MLAKPILIVKFSVVVSSVAAAAVLVLVGGKNPVQWQPLLQASEFGPLIFLAVHVGFSLLFLPRALLATAAGLVFGFWAGLLWASLGSVLGALAGFFLMRFVSQDIVAPAEWTRLEPALRRAEQGGWRAVAMLRMLPVMPHSLANYLLGLTKIGVADFAVGSIVGQLPMTIAYVQFGAAGASLITGKPNWILPTVIGVIALALSMAPRLLPCWYRERPT